MRLSSGKALAARVGVSRYIRNFVIVEFLVTLVPILTIVIDKKVINTEARFSAW